MRHLMLAFMILLLPLRGWMGDAMATEMAAKVAVHAASERSSAQVATKPIATSAMDTGAGSQFNHDSAAFEAVSGLHTGKAGNNGNTHKTGHAAAHDCADLGAGQTSQTADANDGHCGSCQACQACHTLALSAALVEANTLFAPSALRHAAAVQFASAPAALGQKPPIS